MCIDQKLIRYRRNASMNTFSMKYGYEVTKELLKSEQDFTAIYAISDSMAIGACKAIFETGKKVPLDYSVAGYDGMDISYYYEPSLTTVRQPVEDMASETIRILFDMMEGKVRSENKIFSAELIIGQSTRDIRGT
jgi:LacI family transcriptional regulator